MVCPSGESVACFIALFQWLICETLPGLNHFSVLEALVEPEHRLHCIAMNLLGV